MWDFLFSAAPYAAGFFVILLICFVILKVLEFRRNKKLKAEYDARKKLGDDIDRLIINR